MARSTSPADVEAAVPVPAAAPVDDAKLVKEEELDDDDCDSLDTWAPEKQAAYWENKWGLIGRFMAFATVRGCEARGIQPASLEDREPVTWKSYMNLSVLWCSMNCNILVFSAGILGPELFGLTFKASVATIVLFNLFACLPVAWFATFGPKLGMRQMVLSRYTFGFFPVIAPALCNACTALGFTSLNAILAGQTLSLASNGSLSWSVGIVLVALIGLLPSFLGLRAMHYFSLALLPISIILFIAIVAIAGPSLAFIPEGEVALGLANTAGGVLGFGSTCIGFVATWAAFSSDFTSYMPPTASSWWIFWNVYLGLMVPTVLFQIIGAAFQCAAGAFLVWEEGEAANGVAGLIGAAIGTSGGARFLLVILALNVTGNIAPSIYSVGLSFQVCVPWLLRVPRYFLAIIITAIYLPVALALSSKFSVYLSNFLYILAYWIALYLPPMIIENTVFRSPVSAGGRDTVGTYDVRFWDRRAKLPVGYAAMISWAVGVPCITAGMAQTWWVGWVAQRIEGGKGDIGFILGFCACALVFLPARWAERRYTGR